MTQSNNSQNKQKSSDVVWCSEEMAFQVFLEDGDFCNAAKIFWKIAGPACENVRSPKLVRNRVKMK